jgi:hypothetical protein
MDEVAWLTCTDPRSMLEFLRSSGKANARKLKLLGLAYLRWACLHYSSSLTGDALLAAEAKADGEETPERLNQGWVAAWSAVKEATTEAERGVLCALVRDLFGPLPFRAPALDPAWCTAHVLALANDAADNRTLPAGHLDPQSLGTLADALEDLGAAELVEHLRSADPHVRGCWALDALMGRG